MDNISNERTLLHFFQSRLSNKTVLFCLRNIIIYCVDVSIILKAVSRLHFHLTFPQRTSTLIFANNTFAFLYVIWLLAFFRDIYCIERKVIVSKNMFKERSFIRLTQSFRDNKKAITLKNKLTLRGTVYIVLWLRTYTNNVT